MFPSPTIKAETANLNSIVLLLIASTVAALPSMVSSLIDIFLASMSEGYCAYEIVGMYSTDSQAKGQSHLTLFLLKSSARKRTVQLEKIDALERLCRMCHLADLLSNNQSSKCCL